MKNINKNLLGERLKSLMKNYNETTYSLSKIFNLSPPTISRYTRGEMIPKMTTITAIAEYFNVSPYWLIGEHDDIYDVEVLNDDSPSIVTLPVFETIKYDVPLFSNKKSSENLKLPIEQLTKWGAVICKKIKDNSMAPILKRDDIAVIKLDSSIVPDRLCAVHINKNEIKIRKVIKDGRLLILQPANFNFDAEVYNLNKDNVQIIGNVVYKQSIEQKEI